MSDIHTKPETLHISSLLNKSIIHTAIMMAIINKFIDAKITLYVPESLSEYAELELSKIVSEDIKNPIDKIIDTNLKDYNWYIEINGHKIYSDVSC